MIKRFKKPDGTAISAIRGQDRLAFALSDHTDTYDLIAWNEMGGYRGMTISFYDLKSGEVYCPFELKRNVVYTNPLYINEKYWFLKVDYDDKTVTLISYTPEAGAEEVTVLDLEKVNLYNLQVMGIEPHIVNQSDRFTCYYPEKFSFPLEPNETVNFVAGGMVYVEAWVEEGWDDERQCAGENYRYYNKLIIKDFGGNTVSEDKGFIFFAPNGDYYIT